MTIVQGQPRTNSRRSREKSRQADRKSFPRSGAVGISFSSNAFESSKKSDRRIKEQAAIEANRRTTKAAERIANKKELRG